jgi:polyisoprenyl-phosphate glycosyltransferase
MGKEAQPKISIIIPTFNSESFILESLEALCSQRQLMDQAEIIVVDDSSSDATWRHLVSFSNSVSSVKAVRLARNMGQAAATAVGVLESQADTCLTVDDDLPVNPEDLAKFRTYFEQSGKLLIYGMPVGRQQNRARRFLAFLFRKLVNLLSSQSNWRLQTSLRIFDSKPIRRERLIFGENLSLDGLLEHTLGKAESYKIEYNPKSLSPASRYQFLNLLGHAANQLIGSGTRVLRVSGYLASLSFLASIGLALWIVGSRVLFGPSVVPGFTFNALFLSLAFSMNFFTLYVMGRYLGDVHSRLKGWPNYYVADRS